MKYLLLLALIACASKPTLYPNSKYKTVGKEQAKQDIKKCQDEANKFIKSSQGKKILKGAGQGATLGAVVGGVAGLLSGSFTRGALQGAAIGGAGGAASGAITPDSLKRSYVNRCLAEDGYEVLGWD